MTTPAQLTAQIVDLLTRWNAQQDQLADWLTGDPAGGPNGDGRYPLTNAEGASELFLSLPSVLNLVSGPAAQADAAKVAAQAAEGLAQAAQAAAEAARNAAQQARTDTTDLRALVTTQQSDVAAKWSDVSFWHGDFGTRYLGPKANPPATNNTGGALAVGALYFDTTLQIMRAWDGSSWNSIASGGGGGGGLTLELDGGDVAGSDGSIEIDAGNA